jgi:Co/Zn/Cd efflux system component
MGCLDGARRSIAHMHDRAADVIGALVIASWALSLIGDTSAILLDINPSPGMADAKRRVRSLPAARIERKNQLSQRLAPRRR